jgi:hypothetical protein
MLGTVAALCRCPVKSMLGEGVDAGDVTVTGLAGDRQLAAGQIPGIPAMSLTADTIAMLCGPQPSGGGVSGSIPGM